MKEPLKYPYNFMKVFISNLKFLLQVWIFKKYYQYLFWKNKSLKMKQNHSILVKLSETVKKYGSLLVNIYPIRTGRMIKNMIGNQKKD